MITVDDIPELLAYLKDGTFQERDVIFELSKMIASDDIDAILGALPEDWRQKLSAWMVDTFDNQTPASEFLMFSSGSGHVPEQPVIIKRIREWIAKRTSEEHGDIEYFLDRLTNGDAKARALSLKSIAGRPRADERLLAACERLLADRTITLLSIPYSFGEVRWLAADAVAAMRALMGRSEPVIIEDMFPPVSTTGAMDIARDTGVPESPKGGIEGVIETLERIASAGMLPRRRIKRSPWRPDEG